MKIDVVILSYTKTDREKRLCEHTIRTMRAAEPEHQFVVAVVESMGGMEHPAYAGSAVHVCPLEPFHYNRYLRFGIDLLRHSESDVLMLCNNDLIFGAGFLEPLLSTLEVYESTTPWWPGYHDHKFPPFGDRPNIFPGYRVSFEVGGWCLAVRKELLRYVSPEQLFPDAFPFWYQDHWYAYTLWKKGMGHALAQESKVAHIGRASYGLVSPERFSALNVGARARYLEMVWAEGNDPNVTMGE